jgi:hypothetical protein
LNIDVPEQENRRNGFKEKVSLRNKLIDSVRIFTAIV